MLFPKALVAILALPGVVIGLIPTFLILNDPWRGSGLSAGYLLFLVGGVTLFLSVRAFYISGKGTLAPWAPPVTIVRVGIYRTVRSPMYIGVLICLFGLSLSYGSPLVGVYTLLMAVIFHLNLIYIEEPKLASMFGNAWRQYATEVPRWLPRIRRVSSP